MTRNPVPVVGRDGSAESGVRAATGSSRRSHIRDQESDREASWPAGFYLNRTRSDFNSPSLRPLLDKYLLGSDGTDAR